MDDDDDYERQRLARIAENEALLRSLEIGGGLTGTAGQSPPPAPPPKRRAPAAKKKASAPRAAVDRPRRQSSRLAGIEADSEVMKRKYEEEAEELQKMADEAKRAKHESQTLAQLLGAEEAATVETLQTALRFEASALGAAASDAREAARAIANGDAADEDGARRELREVLNRMQLRSTEKVVSKRVYSMVIHPRTDRDIVFVGDKEGAIGVWEPNATLDDHGSTNDDEAEETMPTGKAWSLSVHGKSPVTSLKLDPFGGEGASAARTLYSASYDNSVRALDLESGTSSEVWGGDDEVLLSILDILPGTGPTSRNVWVADHRGGLISIDARQRNTSANRWQVCEKKIGGMSVNPLRPHCIATASLDQHIRLFDVRALATLPTTATAPYNYKAVDGELLDEIEQKAQIAAHQARLACTSVDFSPRGNQLVGVSYDDVVKVWDFHPSWLSRKLVAVTPTKGKGRGKVVKAVKADPEPTIAKGRAPAPNGKARTKRGEDDERQPAASKQESKPATGLLHWFKRTSTGKLEEAKPAEIEAAEAGEEEDEENERSSSRKGKSKAIALPSYGDEEEEDAEAPARPDEVLGQPRVYPHNNQTGKWLTLFRAKWNGNADVEPHFTIGAMTRHAEIYASDGTLLRSLYDADHVTAVPAVTATHPRLVGRLATGNASGRCTFWTPPPEE